VEGVRRGDLVTIAAGGDYGKPRPAVVVQSNLFSQLSSVMVLRLTSELHDEPAFRVDVVPTPENSLRRPSQVMIDRAITLPRDKIGPVFGCLDETTMAAISRALAVFLDIGLGRNEP
jgi:mRNA interferase MazF